MVGRGINQKVTMTKTVLEQPELKIQSGGDGVWLHFKTNKGCSASINLPNIYGQAGGNFVADTIMEWCREFAIANPPNAELRHGEAERKA